jgi:hypothetical protein
VLAALTNHPFILAQRGGQVPQAKKLESDDMQDATHDLRGSSGARGTARRPRRRRVVPAAAAGATRPRKSRRGLVLACGARKAHSSAALVLPWIAPVHPVISSAVVSRRRA